MSLYKTVGGWKNFDCIFEFSMKSCIINTINLSCAKIVFPSVINSLSPQEIEGIVTACNKKRFCKI